MYKVLVVDDDNNLLSVLKYNLEKDGLKALDIARREKPDLILLDIMLPGLNGLEICRILRKEMSVPILVLSAKTEEIDKVVGLEVGADDYLTKPFSTRELMARIRAMLRRFNWSEGKAPPPELDTQTVLKTEDLELDVSGHRAFHKGRKLSLSPKEFGLLAFLMRHRGHVFNREQLVEQIWGYDFGGGARTVDVHILSLRRKIGDNAEHPEHLLTIHGLGYKFEG